MESLQLAVYNAAKEGRLSQLKTFLASKSASQVKELTSVKVEGSTPLITASRQGHLDVVQYLIVKCHADMQQCGSVVFDGETIEDAPPLWCAAAAGHFDIVKCLIEHAADPNCRTLTNSTPMRAACFDGHHKIVKYLLQNNADIEIANRHEHTCLMIACYKGHVEIVRTLLEAGADVNRRSIKRNTALHDCAENGSIPVAKLLLKHHAKMQKDSNGMTPLMTSAMAGHSPLTEFFASLPSMTRVERIEANEILGATFLDKHHGLSVAYRYWRKSLAMRSEWGIPLKLDAEKDTSAYDNVKEPTSLEELEECRVDPEKLRMISLLIRERVLGPKHPDTTYYIRYRGAVYADSGDFDKCINLWMYALDVQQRNLEPLYHMTLSSLLSFGELFSFLQNRQHVNENLPKVTYSQVGRVLQRAVREILRENERVRHLDIQAKTEKEKCCSDGAETAVEGGKGRGVSCGESPAPSSSSTSNTTRFSTQHDHVTAPRVNNQNNKPSGTGGCSACEATSQRFHRAMIVCLHLTALSVDVIDAAAKADVAARGRLLYQVRDVRDHAGRTLLHLAASPGTCLLGKYNATRFPSTRVVRVLLECGLDANARDHRGRTPLHHAADAHTVDAMRTLLRHGAHLDFADRTGATPLDALDRAQRARLGCVARLSLRCLAARALRRGGGERAHHLPEVLREFVMNH